jgi:C4-dicarboxylate-specific signal transduction histidine kinase
MELNTTLEQKVVERTAQLKMANEELDTTNQSLLKSNNDLTRALHELSNAQEKLVLSSKMAALGQLIASIAHEINTPLGAILSANTMVNDSIILNLKEAVNFCRDVDDDSLKLFENLIKIALESDPLKYSSKENRKRKRELLTIADKHQPGMLDQSIDTLLEIGFQGDVNEFIEIIQKKNSQQVIDYTSILSSILNSSSIIKTAAEKISRVVYALKIYAYHDNETKKVSTDIAKDIDLVLELYYNKYKYGVEIIRKYHNAPEIYIYPEKLNQVWVNLINNALQSMQYNGKLEIEIFEESDGIIASFTDDGPGIPIEIQDKIFTPFFTTKKSGEGTGLGLDICKKILGEIGGEIDFSSEPGHTVFKVKLKK